METTTVAQPALTRPQTIYGTRQWTLGRVVNRILFWVLVVVLIIYTVFPFFWAVISSILTSRV